MIEHDRPVFQEGSWLWRAQLGAVIAATLGYWLAFKRFTGIRLEDALITFRYAENLASGRGFAYNPGEAVLGTTTPFVTLVLAAAGRLFGTDAIPTAATVVMIAASAGTAALIALLILRVGKGPRTALVAAAVFGVHPATLWTTTGGMETPVVLFLMVASLYAASERRWHVAAWLLAILVITRIDTLLWVGAISAFALFREDARRLAWPAIAGGSILAAWVVFATLHFGSPVPQSVFAKQAIALPAAELRAVVRWGVESLGFPGRQLGLWVVCVAVEATAIVGTGAPSRLIPLVVFPPLLCIAYWIGRAPIEFPWYALPITLCGLVLGVCGADRILRSSLAVAHRGKRIAATGVVTLMLAVLGGGLAHADYEEFLADRLNQANEEGLRRTVGEWLARSTPPNATVATEAIGYEGTYSRRTVIDLAGLISPEVVALYRSAGSHAAGFEGVLLTLHPDYLVLRSFEVDTNQHYHGGALFATGDQRRTFDRLYEEAARFSAPHPEHWGRLAHVTVYKRKPGV